MIQDPLGEEAPFQRQAVAASLLLPFVTAVTMVPNSGRGPFKKQRQSPSSLFVVTGDVEPRTVKFDEVVSMVRHEKRRVWIHLEVSSHTGQFVPKRPGKEKNHKSSTHITVLSGVD